MNLERLLEMQRSTYQEDRSGLARSWPPEHAMDATEVEAFLLRNPLCLLATATPSGHAQARPVRYLPFAGAFWIASGRSQRVRNLAENPWASLVVMDGPGEAHRFLLAEGPADVHDHPTLELRDAWRSRHGADAGSFARAWIEVRPTRLYTYRP